jgi:hypothetical protein
MEPNQLITQTKSHTRIKHMKRTLAVVGLSLLCFVAKAQPTPQNSATVTWNVSVATNIVTQTIAWGPSSGNYSTRQMNLAPNVNSFQLTGLQPGMTYHVAVMATQSIGSTGTNLIQSAWSPEITITTYPNDRPAAPNGLKLVSQP